MAGFCTAPTQDVWQLGLQYIFLACVIAIVYTLPTKKQQENYLVNDDANCVPIFISCILNKYFTTGFPEDDGVNPSFSKNATRAVLITQASPRPVSYIRFVTLTIRNLWGRSRFLTDVSRGMQAGE